MGSHDLRIQHVPKRMDGVLAEVVRDSVEDTFTFAGGPDVQDREEVARVVVVVGCVPLGPDAGLSAFPSL